MKVYSSGMCKIQWNKYQLAIHREHVL